MTDFVEKFIHVVILGNHNNDPVLICMGVGELAHSILLPVYIYIYILN